MTEFVNPLYDMVKSQNLSVIDFHMKKNELCKFIDQYFGNAVSEKLLDQLKEGSKLSHFDDGQRVFEINPYIPLIWMRSVISCGILNQKCYEEMKNFSCGNILEIGSGSGYNAWILQKMGTNVYPIDRELEKKNEFEDVRFTETYDVKNIDQSKVEEIIRRNGSILFSWPREYHYIDKWVELGGKKVIVIAPAGKDFFGKDLCPQFPPKNLKKNFVLEKEIIPPHFYENDKSIEDTIQFWSIIKN